METKLCKKCGKPMTKIFRRYSQNWINELFNDVKSAEGNVEFNLKSGKYQYCLWYCNKCGSLKRL